MAGVSGEAGQEAPHGARAERRDHRSGSNPPVMGVVARRWSGDPHRRGLIVLDVDGEDGAESLHQLERQHGELPETARCVTGSGGAHYYFRGSARNSVGKIGAGLDIRADGGYVVAPPSPHLNGRSYEWDLPPEDAELPGPRPAAQRRRRTPQRAGPRGWRRDPGAPAQQHADQLGRVDAPPGDGSGGGRGRLEGGQQAPVQTTAGRQGARADRRVGGAVCTR